MEENKVTIRIDSKLWQRAREAARSWAEREGLPPKGKTNAWVSRAVLRAVEAEEKRRQEAA